MLSNLSKRMCLHAEISNILQHIEVHAELLANSLPTPCRPDWNHLLFRNLCHSPSKYYPHKPASHLILRLRNALRLAGIHQLATLMFGQLSGRESLRDVVLATQVHAPKATHLGFGKFVTRSNLSKANNNRDYRIFEEFAYQAPGARRRCTARLFWAPFGGHSSLTLMGFWSG